METIETVAGVDRTEGGSRLPAGAKADAEAHAASAKTMARMFVCALCAPFQLVRCFGGDRSRPDLKIERSREVPRWTSQGGQVCLFRCSNKSFTTQKEISKKKTHSK